MKISKKTSKYILLSYLLLYLIITITNLELFPFVHSDEPWLSGLTRNMMTTKSIYSTETFFDLYPRFPHSIKLIFHVFQMPFILLFGYQVFSVRLLSVIFGLCSLVLFYKISVKMLASHLYALSATLLLSLNIQFIYASRFARQEIVMVFFFLLAFVHYVNHKNKSLTTHDSANIATQDTGKKMTMKSLYSKLNPHLLLGLIIGTSIGIHPNSFLIAIAFGMLYLGDILRHNKRMRDLIILVTTTGIVGGLFVILSFIGDSDFINHYTRYGNTLGVSATFIDKVLTLPDYYLKLYQGISGTYYTPPIYVYFILFAIITLVAIIYIGTTRQYKVVLDLLLCIIGITIGSIIIGRYNQTSIIFIFPFFYLLGFVLLKKGLESYKQLIPWVLASCILISGYSNYQEMKPYMAYSYRDYLQELSVIPPSAKTLGNLNMEFYFKNGALYDYRNLTHLEENNMDFGAYIHQNNIDYIIYTEELDYLHRNPNWQVLYGEDTYYYEDMLQFIENSCTLVDTFTNPVYGIRIPKYMFDYDWEIRIYKVNAE